MIDLIVERIVEEIEAEQAKAEERTEIEKGEPA